MKVINLFGGPCAGKSSTAAGLFFKMKRSDEIKSVELVTEFSKKLVYAGREKEMEPENQLYVTSKQYNQLFWLIDHVDWAITDSPIIQGLLYAKKDYFPSFFPLVREIFNSFDNINIYLKRVKPYDQYGRIQTEFQSNEIAKNILKFLDSNNIEFITMDGDNTAPDKIYKLITTKF